MPSIRMTRPGKSKLAPLGTVAGLLATYEGATRAYQAAKRLYEEHFVYTVAIREDDSSYREVIAWLSGVIPGEDLKAVEVATVGRRSRFLEDELDDDRKAPPVKVMFNDDRARHIEIDGHKVKVQIDRQDPAEASKAGGYHRSIVFSVTSRPAREAVVAKVSQVVADASKRPPVLFMVNQWGTWTRRDDLPLRALSSVVLPAEQKAAIVDDLGSFLEAESKYVSLSIPWHRGYLLHGKPGVGKSSLVKALAQEFNLDLWYVSLADLKEDASLANLLAEVKPRSILLLEDIDTVQLTHSRDETASEASASSDTGRPTVSLGALLNSLDGVATPHGLITFMTTNHYDRLDEALVRAGRMDRVEELSYPGPAELDGLYRRFYDRPFPLDLTVHEGSALPVSQAAVSEVFKRNLYDWEAAAHGVVGLIRNPDRGAADRP